MHKKRNLLRGLPYPSGLLVDIHSYCNAECLICPYPQLSKKNPMGIMPWDLYKKIIDDYAQMMDSYSFKGVLGYCQMGEPFILKDIAKWTKYASEHGIFLYFNTNASLLYPDILNSLLDAGFSGRFNISFHGLTKDVYERIMHLNYENTMKNINYLLEKYPAEKISINAVSFEWPPDEEKKVLEYWGERQVHVTISKALSRCGLVPGIKQISKKRIAGCRTERVFFEMVISFNGDVLLCCHDMDREVIIGNLKESSIDEIWTGNRLHTILNKIYHDKNLPENFLCKRCEESDPYWSPRRIVKKFIPQWALKKIRSSRKHNWIITDMTS